MTNTLNGLIAGEDLRAGDLVYQKAEDLRFYKYPHQEDIYPTGIAEIPVKKDERVQLLTALPSENSDKGMTCQS